MLAAHEEVEFATDCSADDGKNIVDYGADGWDPLYGVFLPNCSMDFKLLARHLHSDWSRMYLFVR